MNGVYSITNKSPGHDNPAVSSEETDMIVKCENDGAHIDYLLLRPGESITGPNKFSLLKGISFVEHVPREKESDQELLRFLYSRAQIKPDEDSGS